MKVNEISYYIKHGHKHIPEVFWLFNHKMKRKHIDILFTYC